MVFFALAEIGVIVFGVVFSEVPGNIYQLEAFTVGTFQVPEFVLEPKHHFLSGVGPVIFRVPADLALYVGHGVKIYLKWE